MSTKNENWRRGVASKAARMARAAGLADGRQVAADHATALLEAVIEAGDRV